MAVLAVDLSDKTHFFPLAKPMLFRACDGFTSASRCIITLLTKRQNLFSFSMWSTFLFWRCWIRRLWEDFCPKIFTFLKSGQISVCCPQPGRACRSSSWSILTCSGQFWPEVSGRKTKGILPISQLHLFYVLEHRVQTVPEYLTLLVKYTTFLDFS